MMEMFNKKKQRVNVTQYDPPTCSAQKTGGQQEERHGVVHHVQEEHQQTKCKGPILKRTMRKSLALFLTVNL